MQSHSLQKVPKSSKKRHCTCLPSDNTGWESINLSSCGRHTINHYKITISYSYSDDGRAHSHVGEKQEGGTSRVNYSSEIKRPFIFHDNLP